MFLRNHHVLRAPDDGGATGAPAAAPAAAPAEAPAAAPAPAAAAPASAPAASPAAAPAALAAGAPAPGAAPAAAPAPAAADPVWGRIPEKFRVKNEDGSANLNASWDKVAEHRDHLERRLGAGDVPPKEAKDYATTVPEALKEAIKVEELAASPKFQEFRDTMHAAGLSQKQFDQVVGKMLDYSISLQQGQAKLSETECVTQLKTEWKDDAAFTANIRAAYRAAETYGDVQKVMAKYGNDPDVIRILANVGKELGEDTSAGAGVAAISDVDAEALTKSKAYWDVNDPEHASVKAKVQQHFDRKFGTGAKSSNSLAVGTL